MFLVTVASLLQTCEIILVLPCFKQVLISDGLMNIQVRPSLVHTCGLYTKYTLSMQKASAVIKYFRTNNRGGEGASPVCAALGPTSSWLFCSKAQGVLCCLQR